MSEQGLTEVLTKALTAALLQLSRNIVITMTRLIVIQTTTPIIPTVVFINGIRQCAVQPLLVLKVFVLLVGIFPLMKNWYTLENYLKDGGQTCDPNREDWEGWGCATAGTKLKPNGSSGFEGNLAGVRGMAGNFVSRDQYGIFWPSSPYTPNPIDAWCRQLLDSTTTVWRCHYYKTRGSSVRCLKD